MKKHHRSLRINSTQIRKSSRTFRGITNAIIEALENRTLLSASLSGTTLNVTGTSGADTFTLSDSGTTITVQQGASTFTFADASVAKIVVNPTAGGDTVNVLSNTKPIAITGGGLDTVNIGNSGTLAGIAAGISVGSSGPRALTNLIIDGSGDISGPTVTLTDSSITNAAPGTITYTASQLLSLTLKTDFSVTVASTGVLVGGGTTTIDGIDASEGNQNITVQSTNGSLSIDASNLTISNNGSTQAINGEIDWKAEFLGQLFVDDSADTIGRTVVDDGGTITGISPAPISYGGDVRGIVYFAGSGNDNFSVADGRPDIGTEVDGDGGNDSLTVGGGNFQDNANGVYFDGGTGANSVTVDESSATSGQSPNFGFGNGFFYPTQGMIDANFILAGNVDGGFFTFTNTQQATLLLGSGNDSDSASSNFTVPLIVQGGAGNDTLQGGPSNDSLNGGPGTDVFNGSDGIDSLDSGDGTPVQIIADNIANAPSNGSEGVTVTGNWISSTTATGFYGSDYINDNNSLKGTKSVKFTPNILTAGSYQVYARWTAGANRATNVPFTVTHQGVNTNVIENQQLNNNAWVLLGTFTLNSGTSSSVTVSNTGTNGYVIADAVRFVPIGASATLNGTTLNVNGTPAPDTMTLSDDGTTITLILDGVTSTFADSAVSKIVVNPSVGGDTVNLLSNTKPVTITGGGLDTVNIGDGSIQKIAAAVSVDNPTSFTNLTVNASTDSGTSTLTDSTLSGIAPAVITYNAGRLSALTIIVSGTVTVNNTGILHNNAATLIEGQGESDFIQATVLATTGALTVNLSIGGSAFIGQGSVQDIKGALVIEQDALNGSSLSINDSNDPVGRNVVVSAFATITGLAPVPIVYQDADSGAEMHIALGNGNDTLTIDGGAYPVADYGLGGGDDLVNLIASTLESTINGGAGNDTLHLSAADPLSDFATFDGGIGTNSVVVDDNSNTPYFLGTGGVSDIDGAVTFQNIQMISLLGGTGDNNLTGGSSPTIPALIHGGDGNDMLNGGSGDDTIFGDAGNDTINGGDGNDSLNGGTGDDVLIGGTGIDTLDGGDGAPIQIIADNIANAPSNGSEGVTVTGNWISSTTATGFYGSDYINDNNSLKGTKSVKFTPNILTAGSYQVYARWTAGANRATNVPFTVTHQGVNTNVIENQQLNNNAWVLLGTFTLNAGTSSSVTVSNTGTNGYVIADAVRFVPVVSAATASISGTVFNDKNANGTRDPGESGVAGRIIYIDSNKDDILDNNELQTTTDSAGSWSFTGLSPGTYRIREQNLPGVRHTDPTGSANFYDVTVATSAITGKLFGDVVAAPNPNPILAINAGGPSYVLNTGVTYAADNGFTGGTATTAVLDVGNTDNDPIYYSYRSGSSFSYSLSVPNGNYSLVLNWVDPTKTAAGQRKFNVSVQGKQVLTNFDIVASAGAKTAISKAFAVTVTNGILTISLTGVVDNAILSGIVLDPA